MEISKVETFAYLVPKRERISNPISSSSQRIIASPADEEGFYLYLEDGGQELSWNVSQSTTPEINSASIADITRSIELALVGYDADILMISEEDSSSIYKQRKADIETILRILEKKIQSSNQPTQIEYAYLGLTDDEIYDLRKDAAQYSNDTFFAKGLDAFLKKVDSIADIRDKIKRGSIFPFVLSIRLTDMTKNTQGNLQIVDLLRPPFTLPNTRDNRHIYQSLSHLMDMIHKLVEPDVKHSLLNTNTYALCDLLSKSLAGRTKFTVYAYLNDQVEEDDLKITVDTLNCLVKFGRLPPSRLMPNISITTSVKYQKIKAKSRELVSKYAAMEQEFFTTASSLKLRITQVKYLEAAYQELLHRPSKIELDLKKELSIQRGENIMLDFKYKKSQLELKHQSDTLHDQLALLEAQIQQLQSDHAVQIQQLRNDHRDQVQQLQNEHAAAIHQLQNDHTAAIRLLQDDHATQIQQLRKDQAADIQLLQNAQPSRQYQDQINQYQSQISELNQELQSFNRMMEETIEKNKQELYIHYKRKISELKEKHKMKIRELEEKYDETIRYIQENERDKYKELMDSYKAMNENQMTGLVAELKTLDGKLNALADQKQEQDTRSVTNKSGSRKPPSTKSDYESEEDTIMEIRKRKPTDVSATTPRKKRGRPSKKEQASLPSQPESEKQQVVEEKQLQHEQEHVPDITAISPSSPSKKKRGRPSNKKQASSSQREQEHVPDEQSRNEEQNNLGRNDENEDNHKEEEEIEIEEIEMEDEVELKDNHSRRNQFKKALLKDLEPKVEYPKDLQDTDLEEKLPNEYQKDQAEEHTDESHLPVLSHTMEDDEDDDFMQELNITNKRKLNIKRKLNTKRKSGRSRKSPAAATLSHSLKKQKDLSSVYEDSDEILDVMTVDNAEETIANKEVDGDDAETRSPVLGSTTIVRQSPPPPPPPSSSSSSKKRRRKLQQSSQPTDNYWADSNVLSPFSEFLKKNVVIQANKTKGAF